MPFDLNNIINGMEGLYLIVTKSFEIRFRLTRNSFISLPPLPGAVCFDGLGMSGPFP